MSPEILAPRLIYDNREKFFAQSIDGEPDVIYGHLAREGDDVWAQFWMYYTKDYSPLPWRRGHDGDWEMIQILLDRDPPSIAVYAQHTSGERRARLPLDDPFTIYVALGKHSSYYEPGIHRTETFDWDLANGKGRQVVPRVELAPDDGWASHARWGSDDRSPVSPGRHRSWRAPSSWAASLAK